MKEGWKLKKLNDVAKAMYGYTEKASVEAVGPKFLRITDIQHEGVNWDSVPYCPITDGDFEKYKLNDGDIVFARTGATTGKSYLVTKPPKSVFASYLIRLHINVDCLLPSFLFMFFQTNIYWERINAGLTGSAQGGFNASKLSELEIPIPPLSEQQRIVLLLDEAFTKIDQLKANAERNLQNAKELFLSVLTEEMKPKEGWKEKTLAECCEICSKLIDPRKDEYQNHTHIGAGNIESEKGTLINLKTAKEENLISGKFLFDETMVLYSKIRPYLKKVVKCKFSGLCSADIYPLVPIEDMMIRDYLYYILLSTDFTDYAILGSQRAGMPKVNREHLFAYKLHIPEIDKQHTIVHTLEILSEKCRYLETNYQKTIEQCEEMKKTILAKAFNGEL